MENVCLLGNCLSILPTIPADLVELVLTDIPYNNVNRPSNGLRNLDKGAADTLNFNLTDFLLELNRVCYGSFYIFCEIGQVTIVRDFFKENGLSTRLCIWEKTNPSPMNGQHIWLSSLECCVFAKKKKAVFHEHCKSPVWRYPTGRNKFHPTEKPLKLFKYIIETSSEKGNIVLDPCMGGGTTVVAAKEVGRKYIGIELDNNFYTTAISRLQQNSCKDLSLLENS